jgi:hypothetical protein
VAHAVLRGHGGRRGRPASARSQIAGNVLEDHREMGSRTSQSRQSLFQVATRW